MMLFSESKYNWLLTLVIFCTPYALIIFLTLRVDPMIQMVFWMIYICTLVIVFVTVPQYEYRKHQEPCDGSLFMIGPLIYMDHTSADMLLGYEKQVEEIKIDWENRQLKLLEASTIFERSVQTVASKVSKELRGQTRLYKRTKPVDEIMKGLNIDPSLTLEEQLAQASALIFKKEIILKPEVYANKINEQLTSEEDKETKNIVDNAIEEREEIVDQFIKGTKEDSESETEQEGESEAIPEEERGPTPEEIQKAKESYIEDAARKSPLVKQPEPSLEQQKKGEIAIQPRMPSFDDVGIPTNQQIELLRGCSIYLVHLYHPEVLEGFEFLEFEQIILILPGPIQEVLATRKMKVMDHDDYQVNVQGCSVLMCCLGFVIGRIPMIKVYATENLLKFQNLEAIKADTIQYSAIHFATKKILEDIIYKLLAEQDPFQKRIEASETKSDALLDYIDYLIQDIKADRYIRASPDLQRSNQELEVQLAMAKKWKPFTIVSLIACCIMLFIIAFILAPAATTNSSVNTPPKKSSLVDLYYLLSFLKFSTKSFLNFI